MNKRNDWQPQMNLQWVHVSFVRTFELFKSSQTLKVVNRVANAFRRAAFSLTHSRSALGAFYRRL